MRAGTAICAAALAILNACACDTVPADAFERCASALVLPSSVATDILFVVDDSGSMAEEQVNLADNLGAFVLALFASPVENEFQIGITTTSVQDFQGRTHYVVVGPERGNPYPAGALVARDPATATPGDLLYDLEKFPATNGWGGQRILSKSALKALSEAEQEAAIDAFKENFRVGTYGSGKEQPFRAARLALSDRIQDGTNAGFLRHGARLAVIFVTDEDDCSDSFEPPRVGTNAECHDLAVKNVSPPRLDTVDGFASFLLGPIGGELRDVVVGAIAGLDPDGLAPSCGTCSNLACSTALDKADRFAQLVDAVGGARMRLGSICDASFGDSLVQFAEVLMPTSLPLEGTPADYRMLAVTLTKPSGGPTPCTVASEGSQAQATADAVYSAPRLGRPAMLTFQNGCRLDLGDRIDVKLVCAG
jgi:hypothetical protein